MAKSKVSPSPPSAVTKSEAKPEEYGVTLSTGDAEKVGKLKSLNTLLVKQTSDARKEIGKLQSQLEDMDRALEYAVASDLDDAVFRVVMKETLREVERKAVDAVREVRSMEGFDKENELLRRTVEAMEQGLARLEREKGDMERYLASAVSTMEENQEEIKANVNTVESLQKKSLEMEDALTMLKAELNRMEMEKKMLLEEKTAANRKLQGLVEENDLVFANLNREMSEMARKKDEIEQTCKAKEVEMQEALALAKAELDRLEKDRRKVEQEKNTSDTKLKDFTQESYLVVANMKKEMDEMTRKKDELEQTRKDRELQMEETLASAKVELNCAIMEKRKVEEEKSLDEKRLKDLTQVNNTLMMELNEMTRKKDEVEQIRKVKEVQANELEISNDKFLKEIQRLQSEVQMKVKDIMEKEIFFNLQVQEMTKEMGVLNKKLNEVVEEQVKNENVKSRQELKIIELEGEGKQLKETLSLLERSGEGQAEEILRLQAEKISLQESIHQQNEKEKNWEVEHVRLQKNKEILEQEVECAKELVSVLQVSGDDQTQEILRLQDENVTLQMHLNQQNDKEQRRRSQLGTLETEVEQLKRMLLASKESEKHQGEKILWLQEEKDAIQRNLHQQCEKERCMESQFTGLREANDSLAKEVEHLKHTISSLEKTGKDQGEDILKLRDEKDVIQKKFYQQLEKGKSLKLQLVALQGKKDTLESMVAQLRAVADEHTIAEKEMESMKKEIVSLKNSVAYANRKGFCAWVCSATTAVAALAYAVKNH